MFDRLRCLFGFHDWVSWEVGKVEEAYYPADSAGTITIHQMPRTFWDNECRRCLKLVGPTWRYQKRRSAKP